MEGIKMKLKTYRKLPVVIEAFELTPDSNPQELMKLVGPGSGFTGKGMIIPTLEGDMIASIGDFVIRGVQGEWYPCKPDIFKQTYEEA